MKRHRTDPNILVESMPCGCRLEMPIERSGYSRHGDYQIVTLADLHSQPPTIGAAPKRLGHLYECEDHKGT